MPFFKETEQNPNCCGCNKPEVVPDQQWTNNQKTIHDFGTHVVETDIKRRTDAFVNPRPAGDSYYNKPSDLISQFENAVPNYKV
jgi:hypothetical protein